MDAKEMKIQALKEVISRDKVQYEDKIADLRVEITQVSERLQQIEVEKNQLQEQLDQLAAKIAEDSADVKAEVVEGEIVQEEEAVPARAKKSAK